MVKIADSLLNLKCKKCNCRLINWTWKEKICTVCMDKRYRKKMIIWRMKQRREKL